MSSIHLSLSDLMGKAQTTPQYVGNVIAKEPGQSKSGNVYFKVKVDTHNGDLYASGRDYEVLYAGNVPIPIRYNVGTNNKNEPTFLNDVEVIQKGDPDMPEPPPMSLVREADPMFREKSILSQWAIRESLIQVHWEVNVGKINAYDPIRHLEIAKDFCAMHDALVELRSAKK